MQASNYLARNFATLGPSRLQPPFKEFYTYNNLCFIKIIINFLNINTLAGVRLYTSSQSQQSLVFLLNSRYPTANTEIILLYAKYMHIIILPHILICLYIYIYNKKYILKPLHQLNKVEKYKLSQRHCRVPLTLFIHTPQQSKLTHLCRFLVRFNYFCKLIYKNQVIRIKNTINLILYFHQLIGPIYNELLNDIDKNINQYILTSIILHKFTCTL